MSYGNNGYAVAEPVGKSPVDHGTGRPCVKCGYSVSRYTKCVKGLLLCEACWREQLRPDSTVTVKPKTRKPVTTGKVSLPNLRPVRCEKGFSAAKLGRAVGCGMTHVYNVERENRNASTELATNMARVLGVPLDVLERGKS